MHDLDRARGYYIEDFLIHLSVERSLGRRTIREYEHDLKIFFDYLEPYLAEDLKLSTIDPRTIREFLAHLRRERDYTANALNRKIACLKGFFRFLEAEGHIPASPMQRISSARDGRHLPKVLTEDEVMHLLDTAEDRIESAKNREFALRDRAILELFYATGIRLAELVGLDMHRLDLERRSLRVIGKGNKERHVFLNRTAAMAVKDYLDCRPKARCPAVFLNRFGDRLSRRAVEIMFARLMKEAGIEKSASPHTLRHSFATHMLEGGSDLVTIKELLGHENLSTTQIYTNLSRTKMREVYETAHPRDAVADQKG
ncbi:MAG: tyrosine recombinase XerC [Candidatus Eremiobacteraeota bacterium]|nr:tyrosine recombinase XerC [Candidatus Eremiobacteraeota bacterium]